MIKVFNCRQDKCSQDVDRQRQRRQRRRSAACVIRCSLPFSLTLSPLGRTVECCVRVRGRTKAKAKLRSFLHKHAQWDRLASLESSIKLYFFDFLSVCFVTNTKTSDLIRFFVGYWQISATNVETNSLVGIVFNKNIFLTIIQFN